MSDLIVQWFGGEKTYVPPYYMFHDNGDGTGRLDCYNGMDDTVLSSLTGDNDVLIRSALAGSMFVIRNFPTTWSTRRRFSWWRALWGRE